MSINPDHIDQLAAIIREVDGSHTKGAAELAEAILAHPGSMWQRPGNLAQPEGDGPSLAEVDKLCAEFGFHYDDDQGETLEILQEMITAALARWGRPAALPAPEVMEVVGNCARIELVVALHTLASQFEIETAAFSGDDLKAVQGHIRHARKIAAKHNQNGPRCAPAAPPAPEMGELGELADYLRDHGTWLIQSGYANESIDTRDLGIRVFRAATQLQQQEARIAALRSALADCGRAVVPVAVRERLPSMEDGDFDREGRCWWGDPGGEQFVPSWRLCERPDDSHFTHWRPAHAIPLPQAEEVEA